MLWSPRVPHLKLNMVSSLKRQQTDPIDGKVADPHPPSAAVAALHLPFPPLPPSSLPALPPSLPLSPPQVDSPGKTPRTSNRASSILDVSSFFTSLTTSPRKLSRMVRIQLPTSALLTLNDGRMGFFVTPRHSDETQPKADGNGIRRAAQDGLTPQVFLFVYVQEIRRLRNRSVTHSNHIAIT